jgi:hypothetical protein
MAKFVGWLADEAEQGKRPSHSSITNATIPLRAMFGTAVAEGRLRHDPTTRLKLPPRETVHDDDEGAVRALSREQLRRSWRSPRSATSSSSSCSPALGC